MPLCIELSIYLNALLHWDKLNNGTSANEKITCEILQHIKAGIKPGTLCNLGRQMKTSILFVACCIGKEHINLLAQNRKLRNEAKYWLFLHRATWVFIYGHICVIHTYPCKHWVSLTSLCHSKNIYIYIFQIYPRPAISRIQPHWEPICTVF